MKRNRENWLRRATLIVAALVAGVLAGAASAATHFATADDAADALIARKVDNGAMPEARRVLEVALRENGEHARWTLGLAIVALQEQETDRALELAEKAAALDTRCADIQYWLGIATFATARDVSVLRMSGVVSRGRRAWDRALELDPRHADTHEGLAGYYTFAPAIAGGNYRKAHEHVDALLVIDGAEHRGHIMHAALLGHQKKWREMDAAYGRAVAAAPDRETRRGVLRRHASSLLRQKNDPRAALAILVPLCASDPDDATAHATAGAAHQELKQHAAAVEAYARVLEIDENASASRLGLAECYAALGEREKAIEHYEAFIARLPDDERARDAQREIRRLRRGR